MLENTIKLNNIVEEQKEKEEKNKNLILPLLPLESDENKKYCYYVVHSWMAEELNLSGNALLVYAIIFGFNNSTGKVCNAGRKFFAKMLNTTDVTISRCIKELESNNLIIVDRIQTNEKTYNYYAINAETLFNKLYNKQPILFDYYNCDNVNADLAAIEIDKLILLAKEFKLLKESNKNNINNDNRTYAFKDISINTDKEMLLPPLQNVIPPVTNVNTNNIINNIDNNIETNKNNIFISTAEAESNNTNNNNINNIVKEKEIKRDDKKQVFNLSGNKNKTKTKTKPKNNKSEKAANNIKLFNLIKQMFANDEINEPKLVEILTKYLQGRIGMRNAKSLTYEVWEKQLELLLDICEGDYEYAYEIVMQAYLGQYRVMCFPNQKKSNKSYYGNNRKMSYNINVSDEQNNLSKKSIKERKELLQDKLARDENGNSIKF